jgi:hypothetical protein
MKVYHATQAARRYHDVYLSDFMPDTGTPLQWAVAWEVVGARERAERERRAAENAAADAGAKD